MHAIVCKICSANQKSEHRQKHTSQYIFIYKTSQIGEALYKAQNYLKCVHVCPLLYCKTIQSWKLEKFSPKYLFKPEASTGVKLQLRMASANAGTNTCSEGYIRMSSG